MTSESVGQHYVELCGPPTRAAEFRRAGRVIGVWKWSESANPEGVTLYATVGASQYPMSGLPSNHRVEFFIGLKPEHDEIASPLAALALYPQEEHVSVGHGHTVPVGKPLWPGSRMSTFLILQPVTAIVPPIQLPSRAHVEFLQAVPVFQSE